MKIINAFLPKKANAPAVGLLALLLGTTECLAQGLGERTFGFGLIVGEPLGATLKVWTDPVKHSYSISARRTSVRRGSMPITSGNFSS